MPTAATVIQCWKPNSILDATDYIEAITHIAINIPPINQHGMQTKIQTIEIRDRCFKVLPHFQILIEIEATKRETSKGMPADGAYR